jgi:hypothetical protein
MSNAMVADHRMCSIFVVYVVLTVSFMDTRWRFYGNMLRFLANLYDYIWRFDGDRGLA